MKTKGKRRKEKKNPFCELGLTEDQNVLQISGETSWDSKRSRRDTETNRTESEHFVNVHQITFRKTRQMRSEDQFSFFFFFPLFFSPLFLKKTGSNGALLMVLFKESSLSLSLSLLFIMTEEN